MVKRILALCICILLMVALAGCKDDVVATVNDEKITTKEFNKRFEAVKKESAARGIDVDSDIGKEYLENNKEQILEGMIYSKLLAQEARKERKLTAEEIDEITDRFNTQYLAWQGQELESWLVDNVLTKEELAYVLDIQERIAKDVPQITDKDARDYYDNNPEWFVQGDRLEVRHILFRAGEEDDPTAERTFAEALTLAEDVITQLGAGADFATLAKELSEDPGSGTQGGLYTFSPGDGTVPEFSEAALVLKDGEYTREPVRTMFGYHVIKRVKSIAADKIPFDEVVEELKSQLYGLAVETKIDEVYQAAKEKGKVINHLFPEPKVTEAPEEE